MSSTAPTNASQALAAAPVLASAPPTSKPSDWSPLRNPIFRAMWIASAISYIGYEIRNYAAPLLMVDFKERFGVSDGMAAYTFTASTLPIPILVLFAGALADVVDRRKLLIVTHLWMMIAAGALGMLTMMHLMTPWLMLGFLFVIGAGYAMANPAFLAVLPELVDPSELRSAMALNSVNMNVARVLGPAIGGLIVLLIGKGWSGKGAAFLATAISVLGVVWVLMWWKPEERKKPAHPESIWAAVQTGVRYTWFSPRVQVILVRMFLFLFFAGILPVFSAIICKRVLHRTDGAAATLMGSYGVGAIIGVYFMQALQRRFGAEETVTVCTVAYGLAQLGVAWTPSLILGCLAMFVAGFNWVIVPTNFNIATQMAVPGWIKGRAMGMYVLVLWGSMSAGSAVFGRLATAYGPRAALAYAAFGVLAGSLVIFWLKLIPKNAEDFTPAKRELASSDSVPPSAPDGEVWVAVDYQVHSDRQQEFARLIREVRGQRLRNGAAAWALHEKGNGAYSEYYSFRSWSARLRHHERTTKADAALLDSLHSLHAGGQSPIIRYSATSPLGGTTSKNDSGPWLDTMAEGVCRGMVQFFERMDRAKERDAFRFHPRPVVRILPLPPEKNP